MEAEKMGLASLWVSDRMLLPTKPRDSVLSALFQNPVTLARRFATLDRLSGGRAIAGIGQGDFRDEFQAANIPLKRRGKGFEEFVLALHAVWGPDPVSFSGKFYTIPESRIGPKPAQSGGIPLLLGAFEPKALERAARIADGIMPAAGRNTTIEKLGQDLNGFRDMARLTKAMSSRRLVCRQRR